MAKKISIISLGCVRNTVDSQALLGEAKGQGFDVVSRLDQADTVIINTCGFIEAAKKESIDTILDVIALKAQGKIKRIVVAGCLSERYAQELKKEFPEVDEFRGVRQLLKDKVQKQVRLTPEHLAYLKICESCFNHCAFCVIPKIKGRFSSREMISVLKEAERLDRQGVKELNIVGQDITAYGMDLYRKARLADLVKDLCSSLNNVHWIRLLYMYPAHMTDELLHVMAEEKRICKYVDIPLQHISDRILKSMKRNITAAGTRALIKKIRKIVPEVRIRTAFITGLPGETGAEFKELCDFVKEMRFDKVGVFEYSAEEGTSAFDMPGQVPHKVKKARRNALMKIQQKISSELQREWIGRTSEVLIETCQEKGLYAGRTQYDAPDVDGVVYVRSACKLQIGQFVQVKVVDSYEYDLVSEVIL
jgi:ribosomal protein S12 methylthiotransferase